jgi:hypothetical protein
MNRQQMNQIKEAAQKAGLKVRDGMAFGVFGKVTVTIVKEGFPAHIRETNEDTESFARVLEALGISE